MWAAIGYYRNLADSRGWQNVEKRILNRLKQRLPIRFDFGKRKLIG